jgi:hypothetical protein
VKHVARSACTMGDNPAKRSIIAPLLRAFPVRWPTRPH